jgi:hypothetical protein
MKHFFTTVILASFAVVAASAQDVSRTENAGADNAARFVSVDKTSTGATVLQVKYPWRIHDKASIEVRLVTDKKDYGARVRPLRFAMLRFDDDATHRILRTLDESIDHPSKWKTKAGDLDWEIIGRANHLGHAAEWFVHTPPKDSSVVGTTAVFFPPDPWAIGDRLLSLDLPREAFAEEGKLYIWFLRGDRVLWQEELMWPGQK